MKKILTTPDGLRFVRSAWIAMRHANVGKRSMLYPFSFDGEVDYFPFEGMKYAWEQCEPLAYPYEIEEDDGKSTFVGYVIEDDEYRLPPLYVEVDDGVENVRVYKEVIE